MNKSLSGSQPLFPYIRSDIIDAIIIFFLLGGAMLFETYRQFVIQENGVMNANLVVLLLFRAFVFAVTVTFLCQSIFQRIWQYIQHRIRQSQFQHEPAPTPSRSVGDHATRVYISIFFILITLPVRPILQDTLWNNEMHYFTNGYARYDAIATMIILAAILIPVIFMRIASTWTKRDALFSLLFFITVPVAGWINHGPNYDARVYETRRSWITKDFAAQAVQGQKALADAETPQDKATAYYWLGVAANRQGKYALAIDYQLQALALYPTYGAPHSSLSSAYRKLGEWEKARESGERCVELSPDYAWCYYALGANLAEQGYTAEAIPYFEKAVSLSPHDLELKEALRWSKE